MCWIRIEDPAIREEILARLEADPAAVTIPHRPWRTRFSSAALLAFALGVALGWFCGS